MIKQLKRLLQKLSKKISRKNLDKFIDYYISRISNELDGINSLKVLNVGAGGTVETYLKTKFNFVRSIDVDVNREPDQVIDVCDIDQLKDLTFTPQLICMFEVLEHTKNPINAIQNLHEIIDENSYVMLSTPFIFHIHDEPYDFFRFTKYGLEILFQNFKEVVVKPRNGWFETILVLFVRLRMERNILSKMIGNLFILIYFLLTPITYLLQSIIKSEKITTGYFVYAKK
jgi:2-polyprenyl-3-methyl-5-hydroxy-6-metoxy-1,4-benzoquinol methylase|tara:strand:+ start:10191 stop:10877 length:687 start_codon:yes stop_codon:yes gene_type:complete